jgi:hypothetical protein
MLRVVKIGIVTESFLPQINGVTNSVLRILEHFRDRGHEVVVVAPGDGPAEYAGAPVVRVPAVPLPVYKVVPHRAAHRPGRERTARLPTRRVTFPRSSVVTTSVSPHPSLGAGCGGSTATRR